MAGKAWIQFESGDKNNALQLMRLAANKEDSIEKSAISPGEVVPARELLGDMLMETKQYKEALLAYEGVMQKSPNRFNSLYSAGKAAELFGDNMKATTYFKQLLSIVDADADRPEIAAAKSFLTHAKEK